MRVLIFSAYFVWNISLSTKNKARYDHTCTLVGLRVKYPLFLSHVSGNWIFWAEYKDTLKYQIAQKSVEWDSQLFHADEQTYTTKLAVAFRIFQLHLKRT